MNKIKSITAVILTAAVRFGCADQKRSKRADTDHGRKAKHQRYRSFQA